MAGSRDREMAALLDQGFAEVGSPRPWSRSAKRHQRHQWWPRQGRTSPNRSARERKLDSWPKPPARLPPISRPSPRQRRRRSRISCGRLRKPTAGASSSVRSASRCGRAGGAFAAVVPGARGKPVQIVQPSKGGKGHVYRARLLNFRRRKHRARAPHCTKRRSSARWSRHRRSRSPSAESRRGQWRATLTHQALRAWSSLSRGAGEGLLVDEL